MPDTGYDKPAPDLAGLRRELRESVLGPDFADLRRRARRRRRHRLAGGGGVVLIVVALLAGLVLLTPRHPAGRPIGARRTPNPMPSADIPFTGWSSGGVALDAETPEGFLLQTRCALGGSLCEARVQLTADGGKSWHLGAPLPNDASGMLSNGLSPVLVNPALFALVDGSGQPQLVSLDAGRTWQPVYVGFTGVRPVAALDSAPRWYLTLNSPVNGGDAPAGNTVLAYDLAANIEAPLAHQPPIDLLTDVRLASAGAPQVWAAGLDGARHGEVAVSDDGGATWRLTRLAGPPMDAVEIADVNGAHAVLLGRRRADADRWNILDPLSALWATGDGGATFTLAPPGPGRPREANSVLVLSNGEIVVVGDVPVTARAHVSRVSPSRLSVSHDGGRTYGSAGPVDGLYELARIPGTDQLYGVANTGTGARGGPVVLVTFSDGVRGRTDRQLP